MSLETVDVGSDFYNPTYGWNSSILLKLGNLVVILAACCTLCYMFVIYFI